MILAQGNPHGQRGKPLCEPKVEPTFVVNSYSD